MILAHLDTALTWIGQNPLALLLVVGVPIAVKAAGAVANRPVHDEQRLFSAEQRRLIHTRAGNRCEHKPVLWRRCPSPGTHADHIYPHSSGGATALANGQSLCATHNLRKAAKVPSWTYVKRLERRRRRYFPAGTDARVHRR